MSVQVQKEITEVTEQPAAQESAAQTEPTQKETSAPVEAEEKESPLAEEAGDEGEESPAPTTTYKPRDKFKVMVFGSDEQKEHDVPEWLKATMKDEASEKEAIALLEKAYGLDPVKASRAAAVKERDQFKQEFNTVQKTIQDVRQTYQRGDIDAFLDKLAIPHERMLQWALDKVNYTQLPPDQQRVLDERKAAERRAWAAEQQTTTMEQQIYEQTRETKQVMLQSSLSRPDVSTFAQTFDTQAGKPGAFFEEVRATGELAWVQSNGKVDLTPDQAIEQVMKKWSKFIPSTTSPGMQPAAKPGTPAVITPSAKPAVIPNVQGRASSPMKSGPRSLDDLRKLGASKSS